MYVLLSFASYICCSKAFFGLAPLLQVNGVVEALVSLRRFESFLGAAEAGNSHGRDGATLKVPPSSNVDGVSSAASCSAADTLHAAQMQPAIGSGSYSSSLPGGRAAFDFKNSSFAWRPGSAPVLKDLTFAIPAGCLTAVVGAVGAGKSSLLAALLGDLRPVSGSLMRGIHSGSSAGDSGDMLQGDGSAGTGGMGAARFGSGQGDEPVAYVGQQPWIAGGSLRDNVVLGADWEPDRFWQARRPASCRVTVVVPLTMAVPRCMRIISREE